MTIIIIRQKKNNTKRLTSLFSSEKKCQRNSRVWCTIWLIFFSQEHLDSWLQYSRAVILTSSLHGSPFSSRLSAFSSLYLFYSNNRSASNWEIEDGHQHESSVGMTMQKKGWRRLLLHSCLHHHRLYSQHFKVHSWRYSSTHKDSQWAEEQSSLLHQMHSTKGCRRELQSQSVLEKPTLILLKAKKKRRRKSCSLKTLKIEVFKTLKRQ